MKGLMIDIFTSDTGYKRSRCWHGGGHSLGGVKTATLVGWVDEADNFHPLPGDCQVFDVKDDRPAVVFRKHVGHVIAEPYGGCPKGAVGFMAAGAFVHSCDSRFRKAVERLLGRRFYGAVPLHDRYESPRTYRMLST